MRIDAINIKSEGQLIADYRNNRQEIMRFFDYHPYEALHVRVKELHKRNFKRNELSTILEKLNREWGASEATLESIEKLKRPETVAVIGGQQAGLLTGPLYSLNKVISIIQFAKQQEEKLKIPVVPVFWIAGEDHDYEEINHVYMPEKTELKKHKLKQSLYKKTSVTHIELDQNICKEWLNELFSTMEETQYTRDLYKMMINKLEQSQSFTDFFARIILELFQEEGLILIDAAADEVRSIESDYFVGLIENQSKFSEKVYNTVVELKSLNYSLSLDIEPSDGHLFYHLDDERVLLQRTENGLWKGKQDEIELSTEELLEIAMNHPEKLSNNVVSRPLMQEMLLPTLAFIGGPGEISYWAALKPAFQALDLKMPPVVPRLSYTYISSKVDKAMDLTGISINTAIHKGTEQQRTNWLQSKQQPLVNDVAEELKQTIEKAHQPMQQLAGEIRADVEKLSEKNLFYLLREVDFLKGRMEQALESKYEKELEQFDMIQIAVQPERAFQERKWNPLPFLNQYGSDFITQVTKHPSSFLEKHYAVYL